MLTLTPMERTAFILRHMEDQPIQVIADALSASTPTPRSKPSSAPSPTSPRTRPHAARILRRIRLHRTHQGLPMTPFDINPDNDAGHAIDQDDLIAFHLHELSPSQERALHRVLQSNPHLQSESIAIASTLHAFPKHEPAPLLDAAALDRHWQALRPSLTAYIPAASAFKPLQTPAPTLGSSSRWSRRTRHSRVDRRAPSQPIRSLRQPRYHSSIHRDLACNHHPRQCYCILKRVHPPIQSVPARSSTLSLSNQSRLLQRTSPAQPPLKTFPASIAPMPSPATSSATANTGTTKDPTPLIAAAPQASPTQLSTPASHISPSLRPHHRHHPRRHR